MDLGELHLILFQLYRVNDYCEGMHGNTYGWFSRSRLIELLGEMTHLMKN